MTTIKNFSDLTVGKKVKVYPFPCDEDAAYSGTVVSNEDGLAKIETENGIEEELSVYFTLSDFYEVA